jgi:pteridine reductase
MAITRTVFITGGARRIGMAVAKYLHSSGYNIIITYNKSSREANALSKTLNNISI